MNRIGGDRAAAQDVKEVHPSGRCVRTLVTHAELLCRIQRAFASREGVCAACVHVCRRGWSRASTRESRRAVCARTRLDRLERVIGTRVESRSVGARALRYATGQPVCDATTKQGRTIRTANDRPLYESERMDESALSDSARSAWNRGH